MRTAAAEDAKLRLLKPKTAVDKSDDEEEKDDAGDVASSHSSPRPAANQTVEIELGDFVGTQNEAKASVTHFDLLNVLGYDQ